VSIFLKAEYDGVEEKDGDDSELSYAEIILSEADEDAKRRRVIESKYRSTEHVLSTSNLCERLFSQCKILMSDRRKSMHPQTLNEILFLKANKHFWTHPSSIQEVLLTDAGAEEVDPQDENDQVF
jgi:hypothetical protein